MYLSQACGVSPLKLSPREVGESNQPLGNRLLVELENPARRTLRIGYGFECKRALTFCLSVPVVHKGICEDTVMQRCFWAPAEGVLTFVNFLQQA